LNDVPWVSPSSTGAAITGYSLKFEIYVAAPWNKGELWIAVGDWFGWTSYSARYAPWDTAAGGTFKPAGWTTVTIPLNQFHQVPAGDNTGYSASGALPVHISDFPKTSLGFIITNDQNTGVPSNSMQLAIDNVRIVPGQ
jgi:hypothetical protein